MGYPFVLICNKVFKDLRQEVDHVLRHSKCRVCGGQNILKLILQPQIRRQTLS